MTEAGLNLKCNNLSLNNEQIFLKIIWAIEWMNEFGTYIIKIQVPARLL